MTRILMVEDEALVAQRLARLLREATSRALTIHHERTLSKGGRYLETHQVDLLFLDLNLNGKSGFDLLKGFLNRPFHTIIVSAYTEEALNAFEYGVLDFVGKPFTRERLGKALARYFDAAQFGGAGSTAQLAVTIRGDVHFIPLADISYIQAAGIYAYLNCGDGQVHIYDKPLNALMQLLPADYFRIHRSYAVHSQNIEAIKKVKHNTYHVILKTGESLPLSRKSRGHLLEHMQFHNH